ncbi:TPA: hypothetical protein U0679_000316 [Streptococcus suis]|nr:hypothetical protein [Streptococcus suis]HEL2407390.1 hypothetical protein [Streptococcus suis]HEM2900504.1 hypothetical protein [Streptococcus suis]HEM5553807.1 hypothetical protein [Streptococcus suis]HEM6288654.1 hypothetical protein [Streptococcus suis]
MIPKFRFFGKVNDGTTHMVLAESIDFKNGFIYYSYHSYTEEEGDHIYGDVIGFEDCVLMQSTGLFDVNGKEIFEGDVVLENGWRKVAVSFGTQEIEENFGDKRIFQGFNLALGGGYPEAIMVDFEVLGNIYENPDLVEVNND